jgi:hypothetical protein
VDRDQGAEVKLTVEEVLCTRWIVKDENGLRRSTWYQTPQDAKKEQDRLASLDELPEPQ